MHNPIDLRGRLSTKKAIKAPPNYGETGADGGPKRLSSISSSGGTCDRALNEVLKDETHSDHNTVSEVFLLIALCHSIVIDRRTGKLNSSSPDELALVEGAQRHGGYSFEGKDGDGIIVIKRKRDQELLRFHLLNVLEFTSPRRRMSVIVRDMQTDQISLLCKGADSIIKPRLDLGDAENREFMVETQKKVDEYATEGLRTLLLARKDIDEEYYEEWNERFQSALGKIVDRDRRVEEI